MTDHIYKPESARGNGSKKSVFMKTQNQTPAFAKSFCTL
jgi:hypothetical protein